MTLITICHLVLLLACHQLPSVAARDIDLVLARNHESYAWRQEAGHPAPTFSRRVIWTRHEQVGIGNALGGFGRVVLEAMTEDRELIIHSLIFEKFCEILSCALIQQPNDWDPDAMSTSSSGSDVTRATHFQIHSFNSRMDPQEEAVLSAFYAPLGCGTGGERDEQLHFEGGGGSGLRHSRDDGTTHRKQCLFASITRSLIREGPGLRLQAQKEWLRGFYSGSSARFDAVLAIDKRANSSHFDVYSSSRSLSSSSSSSSSLSSSSSSSLSSSSSSSSTHDPTHTDRKRRRFLQQSSDYGSSSDDDTDDENGQMEKEAAVAAAKEEEEQDGDEEESGGRYSSHDHGAASAAPSTATGTTSPTRAPVFDAVVHLRTLALIEDMSTESGEPEDAQGKADRFVASDKFEAMVRCLASQLADMRKKGGGNHHRGGGGGDGERSDEHSGEHAESGLDHAAVAAAAASGLAMGPGLRRRVRRREASFQLPSGGGGGGGGAWRGGKRPLAVFVATDAANGVRERFAERLGLAIATELLPNRNDWPSMEEDEGEEDDGGKGGETGEAEGGDAKSTRKTENKRKDKRRSWAWAAEVDYFTSGLPPAHFTTWTLHASEVNEGHWQSLVGTTAEWLFLAEGRRMLTIKGLRGGEKALPSSFAVSAAAFGRTGSVEYLLSSKQREGGAGDAEFSCDWKGIGIFH